MKQRKLTALLLSAAMSVSAFAALTVTASAADHTDETITISSGLFSDNKYYQELARYNEANKNGNPDLWYNSGQFKFNGNNTDNGIKIDVTDELKNHIDEDHENDIFTVSAALTTYGWNSNTPSASMFFEDSEGTKSTVVTTTSFTEESGAQKATISGDTTLSGLSTSGRIYLCITMAANQHQYANISVSVSGGSSSGYIFNDVVNLSDLSGMALKVTSTTDGVQSTKSLAMSEIVTTEVSGEGSAVLGLVITHIPSGVTIDNVVIE